MKVLRESYTLNEIQDRITDTRNILSALRDSLYILSSALENPDEQREEYEDLAYNVDKYYIGDVESIIGDFERDSKHIEELDESVKRKRIKETIEEVWEVIDGYSGEVIDTYSSEDEAKSAAKEIQELSDNGMFVSFNGPFWVSKSHKRVNEDTVKTSDGKWTNKGKEGTHGKFKTKKEADQQRKAMFAQGFKG